jgi:hypothetical protein
MMKYLAAALMLFCPALLLCQITTVDFRYASQRYFAASCFPYDRVKTVVTQNHGLGYDFGPGPYAQPLTEVTFRVAEDSLVLREQGCADPTIPIFSATFSAPDIVVIQEAFAVPLGKKGVGSRTKPRLERRLGWNGTIGWARPPEGTDPAFRNVAWGGNRPILYRVPVRRGSEKLVALGFCEPYKWGPGTRTMEVRVEGADPLVFDPLSSGKKNEPQIAMLKGQDADQNGQLAVEVHSAISSPDPNPFLNVLWVFPPEANVTSDDLIRGRSTAELKVDCGMEEESWQNDLRADMLIFSSKGKGVTPEIIVRSGRDLQFDSKSKLLTWSGRPFVVSRPLPERAYRSGETWHIVLPHGTSEAHAFVLQGPWSDGQLRMLPDVATARSNATKFWRQEVRLPHSRISVPDSGIQYLLDASIRNLYQIGEFVDGGLEFHPGPSVYRGLWVHDSFWHLSALLYLGDAISVKLAIDRILSFQLPSGQVRVMAPYVMNREAPIVAQTMLRYARMTDDRGWLLSHWDQFEKALSWTEERRKETLVDRASPAYGLFPPGFADGGLGGIGAEYASVYWALIGFRAGRDAAVWLKKPESAQHWQGCYDDLMTSFRRAAARDLRKNASGHWYLPVRVADTSRATPPQQANWPLLDAQGLAHLFDPRDSLVSGTLAMLSDDLQEGLPPSTGWMKDGLWPFFGSLLGITQTYQRDYAAAHRTLFAVANHASPPGTWVEEQLPKAVGTRTSGDASNATASALFIKQVRRLLIMERGDTLELLGGMPDSWVAAGKTLSLKGCPVEGGGKVDLTLSVTPDGQLVTIAMGAVGKLGSPGFVQLDLGVLSRSGFKLEAGGAVEETIRIERGRSWKMTLRR